MRIVAIFIGVLVVVLFLGLIGFLNITVNIFRDKPMNDTINRATRPFLMAAIYIVGIFLFIIWWAVMARVGY